MKTKTTKLCDIPKSKGHIAFVPYIGQVTKEYFETESGDIYSAPITNVIDLDYGMRNGRFEAFKTQKDYILNMIRQQISDFNRLSPH